MQSSRGAARHYALNRLLLFSLAQFRFAIDVRQVCRVTRYNSLRRVARGGVLIEGVLLDGDDVVVLLDLRRALGIESDSCNDAKAVILLREQGRYLGLLVDDLTDVVRMQACSSLSPVCVRGAAIPASKLLAAKLSDAGGPLWLLDIVGWLRDRLDADAAPGFGMELAFFRRHRVSPLTQGKP